MGTRHRGWRRAAYEVLARDDRVRPVDLIFVMAGRMDRKRYGWELYQAGIAPRLTMSVARYEVSKMPPDWPSVHELKSLRDGTPAGDRHFFVTQEASGSRIENVRLRARSTYGEALGLRDFLEREPARTVMVVSTDIHLRRVALTFERVFHEMPVEFCYCAAPTQAGIMASGRFVISEFTKLAGYRIALLAPGGMAHRLLLLTGWGRK